MPRRRLRLSARTLALASAGFFGVLVVAIVIGLTWTSRLVWRATEDRERDAQMILLGAELDETLREHQRLSHLYLATDDPRIDELRTASELDVRGTLRQIDERVEDPAERRLAARLSQEHEAYLAAWEEAEARGLSLDAEKRELTPDFERVLGAGAAFRARLRENQAASAREAARMVRLQNLVALGATAFLIVSLILVALGVTRMLLRPVLDLNEAVRRFRDGDRDARTSGGGSRETDELSSCFNEMIDELRRQRELQLTYLAGVAHDMRNPLGVLKMGLQAIARSPALADTKRLERLERQTERLARMVGDLLDATRIEAGQLELRLEEVDVGLAARSVLDLFAPTTDSHELTLRAPERPVVVRGDPLRIEQVISNLVSNAIKYSPDGGPVEVVISAIGKEAELSVSDRGVGIGPEELPDLFLPFRRRPRRGEPAPGAGLGLSIVRRIVRAHGGRIDVESRPGVGSTFRVWLPLASEADEAPARPVGIGGSSGAE